MTVTTRASWDVDTSTHIAWRVATHSPGRPRVAAGAALVAARSRSHVYVIARSEWGPWTAWWSRGRRRGVLFAVGVAALLTDFASTRPERGVPEGTTLVATRRLS